MRRHTGCLFDVDKDFLAVEESIVNLTLKREECLAGIEYHALLFVPSGEDAAVGVGNSVAGMDTDGGESGDIEEERHVALEFWRVGLDYLITTGGNCRGTVDFNLLYFLGSHVGGEVPVGVFERVTVVVAINENVPDGVVGLFVQTLKCYFHLQVGLLGGLCYSKK